MLFFSTFYDDYFVDRADRLVSVLSGCLLFSSVQLFYLEDGGSPSESSKSRSGEWS